MKNHMQLPQWNMVIEPVLLPRMFVTCGKEPQGVNYNSANHIEFDIQNVHHNLIIANNLRTKKRRINVREQMMIKMMSISFLLQNAFVWIFLL
jgi:hypothetical protein